MPPAESIKSSSRMQAKTISHGPPDPVPLPPVYGTHHQDSSAAPQQHHHIHHQHSTIIGPHQCRRGKTHKAQAGYKYGPILRISHALAWESDSDFSFPKSTNLRRCTKRTQNLDFVYFQFPLTACKIPFAVESETGTHVRSVRTEATIFYIFFPLQKSDI